MDLVREGLEEDLQCIFVSAFQNDSFKKQNKTSLYLKRLWVCELGKRP